MTPEAQRLAEELKAAVAIAVRDHDDDHSSDDFVIQRIWDQVDKLASLIPAGGLAEEVRATVLEEAAKHLDELFYYSASAVVRALAGGTKEE